jgi:hypothetical protein
LADDNDRKIKDATRNGVGVMPASNFNAQLESRLDYLKTFKK